MDSLADRVELAARGGPAGEIKIRESLSRALEEAGVEASENAAPDHSLSIQPTALAQRIVKRKCSCCSLGS